MRRSTPPWLTDGAQGRAQLVGVLLVLIVAIVSAKYFEEAHIAAMRRDTQSLLKDRLVPESLLIHMLDELHSRRFDLKQVGTQAPVRELDALVYRLGQHDAHLKELLARFEQTYLVEDEARHLRELKAALGAYGKAEASLVSERRKGGPGPKEDLDERFNVARTHLLQLSSVQQKVGAKLDRDSAVSAGRVTTLLYFQLGVAFVLGLLAAFLAGMGRSSVKRPSKDSKLH